MSFEKLNTTAQEFWNVFEHFEDSPEALHIFSRDTERTRFLCLLGFTSLDAQVNSFWVARILPEWQEMLSLVNLTLEDRSSLDRILELSGPDLNRAQMIASLRFLSNTGEPNRFSPTFTDCGIAWLLLRDLVSPSEEYVRVARFLFQLQKIRNSCFHTGRDFNELKGREALILFHKMRDLAPNFHPSFLGDGSTLRTPMPKAA